MKARLLASYLTITLITLVVLVYPLGRTFSALERDRLTRDIEHDATVVAGLSEDSLERGARPDLGSVLTSYAKDPGGRIVVVDRNGDSVADSDTASPLGTSFSNRPEISTAIAGGRAEGRRHSNTLGGDLLYVAVPVASSGVVHGAVRITYPSSTLDQRVRAMWLGLALLSIVVAVTVTGVGLALARLVTKPVDRLEDAARRIAAGDVAARAPTDSGAPELRELASVFNETAAKQQQVLEAQRDFVGDASHQLRTPLAALRLQLENIESVAPIDLQPAIASARAETARLGRISEGLLALTRATASSPIRHPTDLAAVARNRSDVWRPIAEESGAMLRCDVPEGVWVSAPPGALEQILDNLIDNAIEASSAGSSVEVSVRSVADTAELHVTDQGSGLSDEQRARALDRFWRGPGAPAGGTGLGLAIVAQLATQCGGSAVLEAADPRGVDAVVVLPVVTAPRSGPQLVG